MIVMSKYVQLVVISLDAIIIAYNIICSTPVQLVFTNCSVIDFWVVYLTSGVDSGGVGILLM